MTKRFLKLSIRRLHNQENAEKEIIDQLKAINHKLDILLKPDKQ